jgi:hypothetical protein
VDQDGHEQHTHANQRRREIKKSDFLYEIFFLKVAIDRAPLNVTSVIQGVLTTLTQTTAWGSWLCFLSIGHSAKRQDGRTHIRMSLVIPITQFLFFIVGMRWLCVEVGTCRFNHYRRLSADTSPKRQLLIQYLHVNPSSLLCENVSTTFPPKSTSFSTP